MKEIMRFLKFFLVICGVALAISFYCGYTDAVNFLTPRAEASPSKAYWQFLPMTINRFPLLTTFGVQYDPRESSVAEPYLADLHSSYVRLHSLNWSLAEPIQGDRLWTELSALEDSLLSASYAGQQAILIVHATPDWARSVETAPCSRIVGDSLEAFGDFMYDAVLRYSYPPYNVTYWEIWNEPDIGYSADLSNEPFGCWADYADEMWGGGYFAEVLRTIYPRIKAANPQAQVVIGGLHLECDPRGEPSNCELMNSNPGNPLYLTGILDAGGGDYFDGVGFHAYDYFPYWEPELGRYVNYHWGSGWDTTGPVINAKASYIREVLSEYGYTDKFLMNTEGALICGPITDWDSEDGCESTDDSLYEQTKARYVTQLYASGIASDLRVNMWYSLFGFRHSDLVDTSDSSLQPAYFSYKFARQMLADATFEGELELHSSLRAYDFRVEGKQVWVLWSLDGEPHTIDLTEIPDIMYDYSGEVVMPMDPLIVTIDPLYLVWTP